MGLFYQNNIEPVHAIEKTHSVLRDEQYLAGSQHHQDLDRTPRKIKKCWLCMVEVDMCFPKNTKIGILQYGILGPQKGGSDTLTISGLRHQHLSKRL